MTRHEGEAVTAPDGPGARHPREAPRTSVSAEGAVVLAALAALLVLDAIGGTPILERLPRSRLAFLTIVLLSLFAMLAAAARRWERLGRTLVDWWPVIGILLVYESLKHLHANRITEFLGIAPMDPLMLQLDTFLFGKALPLWLDGHLTLMAQRVLTWFYIWVYYLGPGVLLGFYYFHRRDDAMFVRLRRGLVFGLLGGYVGYLLVPVAGPLFTIGEQFQQPIVTQPELRRLVFSTLRYNWDCFPSLHTAIPLALTLLAWPALGWIGRVAWSVACTGIAVACVALRFHYGIDIIAGILWAVVVWAAVVGAERRGWQLTVTLPRGLHMRLRLRHVLWLLTGAFAATGFVGLLVEQAFEKMLQTLLGSSGHSSAVVLAVYFLGLTLGGAAYARVPASLRARPLRLYALLEGGVAVVALGLFFFFDDLIPFFRPLLALGSHRFWLLQLLRLVVAGCWIVPITFLMGMSFPAIVDALRRLGIPQHQRAMTSFYGVNLAGAVAGAILGPYLLFAQHGVDGTLLVCVCLDLAVCLVAFRLDAVRPLRRVGAALAGQAWGRGAVGVGRVWVLPVVSFLSGLCFFALEVLWTHLIGAVLGNSVYAFSAMLGVVLLGLGLGSLLAAVAFSPRRRLSPAAPSLMFLGGAAALAASFSRWPLTPHLLAIWGGSLDTFARGEILRWFMAASLILLPATLLGMVFPSLFRLNVFPDRERGAVAGLMVAANAVGCATGALATGFVLIPAIGSEATMLVLMHLAVACAVALALAYLRGRLRLVFLGASALVVLYMAGRPPWNRLDLTSGEQVYFGPHQVFRQSRLLFFHEDTLGGITTVVANPAGVKGQPRPYLTLLTNGKFQGNDAWERDAQIGLALVPAMFTTGWSNALVIGLGTGQSGHVVAAMGYDRIDVAEIAPGIVAAARAHFAGINGRLLDRANVAVHVEDGRNFLLLTDMRYDLITMEISSVWFAGASNLYSQEFYKVAKQRLQPGGVFQQWIQLHHIGTSELTMVIATLRSVFPRVSLWILGGQGILVASIEEQLVTPAFLARFPGAARELGWALESAPERFEWLVTSRLLSPDDVDRLLAAHPTPLNTDRNRALEYATPRFNLVRRDLVPINLRFLAGLSRWTPVPLAEGCEGGLAALGRSVTEERLARRFGVAREGPRPN